MEREITGVKFIKEEDANRLNNEYDNTTKTRYCQALMRAGKGEKND